MRNFRHWLILATFTLAACSGVSEWSWGPSHFVPASDVPPSSIEAPPAVDSPAYNAGLRQVIVMQANVTKHDIAAMQAEDSITPEMMLKPTLGRAYTADCYPALYALLNNAKDDALHISNSAEDHWDSKRPWVMSKSVHLYVPAITRPSYPSGHTVTNFVWADILSSLFPAKSNAFYARAAAIANHRIEAGVHFPYDVSAGKELSAIIYARMKKSSEYQAELKAARTEIRAGHGKICHHASTLQPAVAH